MFRESIRVVTLIGVFALASHAASIGIEGSSCGGDPAFSTTVFPVTTGSGGDFCDTFTNEIPGGPTGDGTTITSLTFQTDLSAGIETDYTCQTNVFLGCTVTVDPDAESLVVSFAGVQFSRIDESRFTGGIHPGDSFFISLTGFAPFQTFEVDVNSPEPGTLLPMLAAGALCILKRRRQVT